MQVMGKDEDLYDDVSNWKQQVAELYTHVSSRSACSSKGPCLATASKKSTAVPVT